MKQYQEYLKEAFKKTYLDDVVTFTIPRQILDTNF